LRVIAGRTGLGPRTVRTITDKKAGKDRTTQRAKLERRRAFDKMRAADYRRKKRVRDELPKRIIRLDQENAALMKAAKGLGRD
jgi:hypothetical protein